MEEKPIDWRGSSLRDIKDDNIFTPNARKEAGHQLSRIQCGLEPDHWKPFDDVGAGAKEIIINLDEGWFRVMSWRNFLKQFMCCTASRRKRIPPANMTRML
jgi:phage-related protein